MRSLRNLLFAATVLGAGGCSLTQGPAATPIASPTTVPGTRQSSWTIEGKGGVSLYRQAWTLPSGSPRATVVLVHGLKDHSNRYGAFAHALVAHGVAVHAFDLRGHGHSGGDRVWVSDFSDYIEDLAQVVHGVQREAPGRPVFVFGHSMGGAIALRYAIEQQPAIAGLVLSAPATSRGKVSNVTASATKVTAGISPWAGLFQLDASKFSRDPAVTKDMLGDPLVFQAAAPVHTAAELLRTFDEFHERAKDLRVPVLALHGAADEITDPDGTKAVVEQAASRDKTLKLYPGLVHDLLHEPEREVVTRDIVAWVEARVTSATPPSP
jgi:alpha-beta hydrolase superfamily lysophospholipase